MKAEAYPNCRITGPLNSPSAKQIQVDGTPQNYFGVTNLWPAERNQPHPAKIDFNLEANIVTKR